MLGIIVTCSLIGGVIIIFTIRAIVTDSLKQSIKSKNDKFIINLISEFKKNYFEFSDISKIQNISELYDKIVILKDELFVSLNKKDNESTAFSVEFYKEKEINKILNLLNTQIEYFHYFNKINIDNHIDKNIVDEIVRIYFSLSDKIKIKFENYAPRDFEGYQKLIESYNEDENNLMRLIKSDDNKIIELFINKYSDIGFSDDVLLKIKELLKSKGYFISEEFIIDYCLYFIENQEILKIVNLFKQNSLNDLDACVDYYLELDSDSLSYHNITALFKYISDSIDPNISKDTIDELIKKKEEKLKLKRFEENLLNDESIAVNIDQLSGFEFEDYLSRLYTKMGYKVELTKSGADQGADLIVEKHGVKTVVQAKRYTGSVGNSSVQEIVAAKNHYKAEKAIVVTNSYFTQSAKELAESNSVELIDRDRLNKMIENYM